MIPDINITHTYKFKLDSRSPVCHIYMHTHSEYESSNYITLGIRKHLRKEERLDEMSQFVTKRFSSLGGRLMTYRLNPWNNDVLAGRAKEGDEKPSHIRVSDYVNARRVIEDLFANFNMPISTRNEIEPALNELEQLAQHAYKTHARRKIVKRFQKIYDKIAQEIHHKNLAKAFEIKAQIQKELDKISSIKLGCEKRIYEMKLSYSKIDNYEEVKFLLNKAHEFENKYRNLNQLLINNHNKVVTHALNALCTLNENLDLTRKLTPEGMKLFEEIKRGFEEVITTSDTKALVKLSKLKIPMLFHPDKIKRNFGETAANDPAIKKQINDMFSFLRYEV